MRVVHYLVRDTSGFFHVRLRVPKDLCNDPGQIIKRPQGRPARVRRWFCKPDIQAFDAIRRGEHMAKLSSIENIRANLHERRGSDYVIEQGPSGLRIEATDRPASGRYVLNRLTEVKDASGVG